MINTKIRVNLVRTQAFLHQKNGEYSVKIVLDVDDNTKLKIAELRDVNIIYLPNHNENGTFFPAKVVNIHGHAK